HFGRNGALSGAHEPRPAANRSGPLSDPATAAQRRSAAMTTRRPLVAVALGLLLSVAGPARAQYTFTTIDVPGGSNTAVNGDSTHASAGQFDDGDGDTHGFVLSQGSFTAIDVPGAGYTSVNGINANG